MTGKFLGRKIDSELEITSWNPPSQVSFKVISGPIPFEATTKVAPEGEGSRLTAMGKAEFGGFFKLAEGMAGKQLQKQFKADNENLKSLMESNQL